MASNNNSIQNGIKEPQNTTNPFPSSSSINEKELREKWLQKIESRSIDTYSLTAPTGKDVRKRKWELIRDCNLKLRLQSILNKHQQNPSDKTKKLRVDTKLPVLEANQNAPDDRPSNDDANPKDPNADSGSNQSPSNTKSK